MPHPAPFGLAIAAGLLLKQYLSLNRLEATNSWSQRNEDQGRIGMLSKKCLTIALGLALVAGAAVAQQKAIAIGTGGTGGVYYPLGGGLANVLSKNLPGVQATAEVTGGSVDNLKLIGSGQSELGFSMADAALDALNGEDKFKGGKVPVRTLMVLYPNRMHVVTIEGTGIEKMSDLKGKRVSTGSPGSATEVMAFRVIEAAGLDKDKDMKRERLGVAESVNAIKDRKIDAFFWVGGLPTAAVTDLGATPGVKIKMIDHADLVGKMNAKYGALYAASRHSGQDLSGPGPGQPDCCRLEHPGHQRQAAGRPRLHDRQDDLRQEGRPRRGASRGRRDRLQVAGKGKLAGAVASGSAEIFRRARREDVNVPGGQLIDRILIAYMILVGIVVGAILVLVPQAREFRLPPYFWVLAAVGAFDLAAYARARGAPGTMAGMDARLLGFLLAIVLMVVIPILSGAEVPKFF